MFRPSDLYSPPAGPLDARPQAIRSATSLTSSGVSSQAAVAALAFTCSGLVAPAITEETAGWPSSQAKASSRMVWSRSCAHPVSFST